jgi:cobyrinic acid a,c-diamide synthase
MPALLAGKTIAVARDAAFCFIYQANLDCLSVLGATVKFFSPLHDKLLPEADAFWLPGGYPELHAKEISENSLMQGALQTAFNAGKPMLAECGGMMALSESINGTAAFGLLTGNCKIEARFQGLGTQHVMLRAGEIGAHTFHYGSFNTPLAVAFQAYSKHGQGEAVYQHGCITASFLHFYFASNPQAAAYLFL